MDWLVELWWFGDWGKLYDSCGVVVHLLICSAIGGALYIVDWLDELLRFGVMGCESGGGGSV